MTDTQRTLAILALWAAMWPLCRIIAWYEAQDGEASR